MADVIIDELGDGKIQRAAQQMASGSLRFPSDIGETSTGQHYITFFIREQKKARMLWGRQRAGFSGPGLLENSINQQAEEASTSSEFFSHDANSETSIKRQETSRVAGSITMYMPNQLNLSHKANYSDAEIGQMIGAVLGGAGKLMGGANKEEVIKGLGTGIGDEFVNMATGLAEGIGVSGAKATVDIARGKVTNNRTELSFQNIDRRTFQFTFRLLPRSAEEADQITSIITMFRYHSMPEFSRTGFGRTFIVPSTFEIQYTPEKYLHKISNCILESVDVRFGGDRTQFFKDGQPAETQLTLQFKELGIITKEKIAQGF